MHVLVMCVPTGRYQLGPVQSVPRTLGRSADAAARANVKAYIVWGGLYKGRNVAESEWEGM